MLYRVMCASIAAGLAQLRQGGLTSTDQILVAEKAGAWSEALALYEQALSQEAAAAAAAAACAPGAGSEAAATAGAQAAASADGTTRPRQPGAAAADVLINAACAVVTGAPTIGAGSTGRHSLSSWLGLQQLQQGSCLVPVAGAASDAAAAVQGAPGAWGSAGQTSISSLQVGHLRCLLQMGHQQTLLRQVDGLMARCLGQAAAAAAIRPAVEQLAAAAAAAAVTTAGADGMSAAGEALQGVQWSLGQLAALGVAGAWRLGAWEQLRGYLSVLEAAGSSPADILRPLSAADRWEVGYKNVPALLAGCRPVTASSQFCTLSVLPSHPETCCRTGAACLRPNLVPVMHHGFIMVCELCCLCLAWFGVAVLHGRYP